VSDTQVEYWRSHRSN